MSTNYKNAVTKDGFTFIQFLTTIAENSVMSHDTNWDPNNGLWFSAEKSSPRISGREHVMVNLWLSFSNVTEDWYVYRFSVEYYDNEKKIPSPFKILDGQDVLTHFAKRVVEVSTNFEWPNRSLDMIHPSSVLWRIHSPANLEALLREYINLAEIKGCIPVFSLTPKDKQK